MEIKVGKDLFSICGKCGEQWHVIVSMEELKVTKVQCKHCMAYHRYRCPPGETNVNRKATTKRTRISVTGAKKKATKRRTSRTASPGLEPDMSRPVRNYAVSETYELGDRIEHPKFGQGVVEAIPGPGKVDVFFEEGRRTLVHARAMSM